jgi:glycerol-3-phosphate dehydrogenase
VRWLMVHEFAMQAADIVWRRTKLGLRLSGSDIALLDAFMSAARPQRAVSAAAE